MLQRRNHKPEGEIIYEAGVKWENDFNMYGKIQSWKYLLPYTTVGPDSTLIQEAFMEHHYV